MRLLTANDIEDEDDDEDDRRGEGSIDQSLHEELIRIEAKRSIDQANQHRYDRAAFPYRMQKMFWLYRYSSGRHLPNRPRS
jgi:hypothetical protein